MNLVFEPEALEEYRDAARYSEDRFGLGRDFVKAIEESLLVISKDPTRFQSVGQGIRIFRMSRFPFYLFYHHTPDAALVTIYALSHHSRRPGYWRKRLPPR